MRHSIARVLGLAVRIAIGLALVACGSSASPSASGSGLRSDGGSATPSPDIATPTPAGTVGATVNATPVPPTAGPLQLTSEAFAEGGPIPVANTCDGADQSPPLQWAGGPAAVSYALVVDDPDAGGFIHWVVYDVAPTTSALAAAVPLPSAGGPPQGRNGFGRTGYGGPCPPSGTHHYRFRLLALASRLSLSGIPTAAQVLAAASGHILGEAILTGTYRRH